MGVAAHPSPIDNRRIVEIRLKDREGIDYLRWVSYANDGIIDYTEKRIEARPLDKLVAIRAMQTIYASYRALFPNYPHVRVQLKSAKEDA
jgi:hypothetical protein